MSGIHVWQDPGGPPVVAAFSSPFFASTWMLVPQTMTWFDAANDTNVAVDRLELSVLTPDASWTVIGNGNATVDGSRFRFAIDRPMPVYAVSFAASPAYVTVDGGQSAAGLQLSAGAFATSSGAAANRLAIAGRAVDWLGQNIGVFPWSEPLTISLGSGILAATATLAVAAQPTAVAIDPEGFYILRLRAARDWARPPISNVVP